MQRAKISLRIKWAVSLLCWVIVYACPSAGTQPLEGTIIFSTYRRLRFAFDIFCVEVPLNPTDSNFSETRITYGEGQNINHNGFFADISNHNLIFGNSLDEQESGFSTYEGRTRKYGSPDHEGTLQGTFALDGKIVAYISEPNGRPQIFFNLYSSRGVSRELRSTVDVNHGSIEANHSMASMKIYTTSLHALNEGLMHNSHCDLSNHIDDVGVHRRLTLHAEKNFESDDDSRQPVYFQDRPSIAGNSIIYISSQESPIDLRQSWTAVYSTSLVTGLTTRLTPRGVVDYSPSVSPSGNWVLVASYGNNSWDGEIHELKTDLYIFSAHDGSNRTLLVSGGGWPSWADDSTFFFHRKADDGWWGIYKGTISLEVLLSQGGQISDAVTVNRVTPPGIHCFTPAASATGQWIAIATRRPTSSFRHIEIFDLQTDTFIPVTSVIAPTTNHYNPFVSRDSSLIGYHKCRGSSIEGDLSVEPEKNSLKDRAHQGLLCAKENVTSFRVAHLVSMASPRPTLSLLRTEGEFPSISPDGSFIAFLPKAGETGVYAMRSDGSRSVKVYANSSFGMTWDRVRNDVVYTSSGPIFHSRASVHIVAIYNIDKLVNGDDVPLKSQVLTREGTRNNAFPSPSPDGKYIVFRSSRSGSKNLYIMDAIQGEDGGLWRLTKGRWTDTMCSWSPDGQWIVFSSDREDPGSGSFSLYLIRPNGTGLHKVFKDSHITGGRANHASFSPDSKSLLFATDYAGFSSEPISLPFQYQGYGDIFVSSLDGKHIERITHVQYENGTPSWGGAYIDSTTLTQEGEETLCAFEDVDWLEDNKFVAQEYLGLNSHAQARCGYVG